MTKEEALKEIALVFRAWIVAVRERTDDLAYYAVAHERIASALDRYAFSIVEVSVPPPRNMNVPREWKQGFNDAREQTLEKARSLTQQKPS
jgi:hypothetical protein